MKNNLLLGITGSIAASKTEKLYELFKDHYNIKLVSTSEGLKYLDDNFKTNNKIISSWDNAVSYTHLTLPTIYSV